MRGHEEVAGTADVTPAPVERLGARDTPVPAAPALEEIFSPKARLLPALRARLAF